MNLYKSKHAATSETCVNDSRPGNGECAPRACGSPVTEKSWFPARMNGTVAQVACLTLSGDYGQRVVASGGAAGARAAG